MFNCEWQPVFHKINLPLNKPSQAMRNSHGHQVGDWSTVRVFGRLLGCWGYSSRAFGVSAVFFWAADKGLQEIWHGIPPGPDHSSPSSLSSTAVPARKDILSCRVTPPRSLQPEWHYHHNQTGTSDIWPLSAWEEGVVGGESQAGVQGVFQKWKL